MDVLSKLGIDTQRPNPGVFSGHCWHNGTTDNLISSATPINNEKLADIYGASVEDYQELMRLSQEAFYEWREWPAPKRGDIIRQVGDALRQHKDALGSLVSLEMGKSKQEGDGEVQEMIDIADFALGQSRMMYGKTMHSERPNHRMYEQWHPYGVIGVISAFNFPVAVWSWNAFIAAICGNVTVWKPSSKTPLCAVAVQHIVNEVLQANQCPPVFATLIPGERTLLDTFVDDKRIPLVSFTGSSYRGGKVAQRVAGRFGHTILELGGNNAIIIDESADLALAIPAVVFGAVGTAGQRCTTTRRLYVHDSIYDDVVNKLCHAYKQLKIGDPLDTANHVGPLIDSDAVDAFKATLASVQSAGGHIVCGGHALDRPGSYVEPTIVVDVKTEWDIVQQETFAPILYVMPYDTLDNAITAQNAVPQGLSSALFTRKLQHAEYYLSAKGSDCGIANINIGTSGAEIGGAFGGEKETGGGREAGSDAWQGYMRRQTNTINWGDDLPLAQGIEFNF